jgi:anion-transporting  ArsA/GET3 family ATPase
MNPAPPPVLDLDALLSSGVRVVVCCGSGGVGKTTTAAAVALRAAESGKRVVVLTIDPARRLAQAMGLTELDNTPRPVAGIDTAAGGSLAAMMLDMKRTFDEVVQGQTTPEKARVILENPFYMSLSASFAGTQEYMAMEKLGQLRRRADADGVDLIVVDTPPSRSALDFLDAPERLGSFLDSRFIRLLAAPAKGYLKVFSAGIGAVASVFTRVLGAQVLTDVRTFVTAFDTLFGGFRARAEQTFALLQDPETAFLVVTAPEPDAVREAGYFVDRLRAEKMPLAGLVLNRVTPAGSGRLSAAASLAGAEALETAEPGSDTARLLRLHAARLAAVDRERRVVSRFTGAHPGVPTAAVPALAGDVHDLGGLREIGDSLAAGRLLAG